MLVTGTPGDKGFYDSKVLIGSANYFWLQFVKALRRGQDGCRFTDAIFKSISWMICVYSRWRHQMKTFSALLALCVVNSPITGEFPAQRPVTRSFDVFFDLRLDKRLSKHSWGWWFETPSRPLWRHCNVWLKCHRSLFRRVWSIISQCWLRQYFCAEQQTISGTSKVLMVHIWVIRPTCVNALPHMHRCQWPYLTANEISDPWVIVTQNNQFTPNSCKIIQFNCNRPSFNCSVCEWWVEKIFV